MCETFAYLRRNCKLFLPSQGSQKAYIIFLTLRLKKKINHHSSRIEFRQLETRAQVPISTILLFSTSSIRLLKTPHCILQHVAVDRFPRPLEEFWKFMKIFWSAPTDFLRFFFFALLINGNEKRCEFRFVNAKIMIWAGNPNLDSAAFFIPSGVLCSGTSLA